MTSKNFYVQIGDIQKWNINLSPDSSMPENRLYELFAIDTKRYDDGNPTYWNAWGGIYDNINIVNITLQLGIFAFTEVFSWDNFINSAATVSYLDYSSGFFYIKIPNGMDLGPPWLWDDREREIRRNEIFLFAPIDPLVPWRNILNGSLSQVLLKQPLVRNMISAEYSGVSLNLNFDCELSNTHGYFDDGEKWKLFNSPIYLYRFIEQGGSRVWKLIKTGYVQSTETSFEAFKITSKDRQYTLTEPMNDRFGLEFESHLGPVPCPNLDTKIKPLIFGRVWSPLIKVTENIFYIASNVTSAEKVVNGDNIIMYGWEFRAENCYLYFPTKPENDPAYVLCTGDTENRVGHIIRNVMDEKTPYAWSDEYYERAEWEAYMDSSPAINIYVEGGDIQSLIKKVIANDIAFFFTKSNGLFTIRKYGYQYATHDLSYKDINDNNKNIRKSYPFEKQYQSTTVVDFDTEGEQIPGSIYRVTFSQREEELSNFYGYSRVQNYKVQIGGKEDAAMLSMLINKRYGYIKEQIDLNMAIDCSAIELLDRVSLDLSDINGRNFSRKNTFVVTSIDYVQDKIKIEEADY